MPDGVASWQVQASAEPDRHRFTKAVMPAFGEVMEGAGNAAWWTALEMDRGLMAVEGDDQVVGTAGAYSLELTVPGGAILPVAAVTAVSVLPTHRRRGIFRALMQRQLMDLHDQGQAISVLLASEATIYGRFGYGAASFSQTLEVIRNRAGFRQGDDDDGGHLELLDRKDAGAVMAAVYETYRRHRPGALSRPLLLWERGAGQPPVSHQHRFIVVHRDAAGVADGYASYEITPAGAYAAASPRTLVVDELVAASEPVRTSLMRYCLDHDLVNSVQFRQLPIDDALPWRLADLRAVRVVAVHDWIWVRLVDVQKALEARRYAADDTLLIDVIDDSLKVNIGRYRLDVAGGHGTVVRTEAEAGLRLDVSELGSIYLGGVLPSVLGRAGRIQELSPGALRTADRIFGTAVTPHCLHWF